MLQVASHILSNPNDKTRIELVFGNVSEDDIICRQELDDLKAKHPGLFTFLKAKRESMCTIFLTSLERTGPGCVDS